MLPNASAAYATYPNSVVLSDVLKALGREGFRRERIFMLLSPTHPVAKVVRESGTQPFEREATATTAGLLGWLSDLGAVVIPKFGFFVRSREFFHALLDREWICDSGRSGTLASLGFSEQEAERVEHRINEVGVLLYISCPETAKTESAVKLLRDTGAEEAGMVCPDVALAVAAA